MEFNLIEMWHGMNNLVRGVVVVLTIQALGCIYVTMDRLILLILSMRKGKKFAKAAGADLASGNYASALATAGKFKGSHLANYIETGVNTFLTQKKNGHDTEKAAEFADRALDRQSETLSDSLHKGMNVLASTGSTAPFVGLLGTVLGILNAFKLVGQEGSGGIGTIGVAIAEALIVTGYGLMVAIPSVLLFNWLSGKLARYEAGLERARSELVDRLETGGTTGAKADAASDGKKKKSAKAEKDSGLAQAAANPA